MKYSAKSYGIPADFIQDVSHLKPIKTILAIALIWVGILGIAWFGAWLAAKDAVAFWLSYPLLVVALAGRQGALLQIVHEGSHILIHPNPSLNNFIGSWFAALPVGLTLDGYTTGHMRHHAGTNTSDDLPTDLEKYSEVQFPSRALGTKFLRDITGMTALGSFFGHNYASQKRKGLYRLKMALAKFGGLALAQGLVFLAMGSDPRIYVLFWALPLITVNMVLLRVRGITEHGAPNQLKIHVQKATEGNFYTRSVVLSTSPLSLLERFLIGSLACNFHHEHHLLPKVPFYNLKKVHDLVEREIQKQNPYVYVRSYFKTLNFRANS